MLPPEEGMEQEIPRQKENVNLGEEESMREEEEQESPTPLQLFSTYTYTPNHSNNNSSVLRLALCPMTLKFENVVYKVNLRRTSCLCFGNLSLEKTIILHGISGLVRPGEILAMLGPSGSGKTSLLSALGGRLDSGKLCGKISYNGQPFDGFIKRRIGFVAQDDVLYPHLTVMETLLFAALLRLPGHLTPVQKMHHAESVVADLGLTKCRNSIIGGPLLRGISGGERKRVSIGQELLINPSLLLLDEPTSGLDSTTAWKILSMVKELAKAGRTIVTTIHQPSSRLYHMFDKVVLLCEGSPIYHGQASQALDYFSSIGFSTPLNINPADLLLDLANGIAPDAKPIIANQGDAPTCIEQEQKAVKEALISAYHKSISTKLEAELSAVDPSNHGCPKQAFARKGRKMGEQWSTSWWNQFTVLLKRGLKERKHEAFSTLRILQVTSVATLAGLLWWHSPTSHIQDRVALLFFFSVFWGFFPVYNAVFTFPQERAMLIKERCSGMYRLSSYFLARAAGDLPMELALPTAFMVIIYWMAGLKPDPTTFLLSLFVLLLSVLVSQSLGLALGAILMDVKKATTLASVTTLVFLMAGGYYVQQIPSFILWLKYLSFSYYCYKLLLGVQFTQDDTYECWPGGSCRVADFPAVKSIGLNHLWIDVSALILMLVVYRLMAFAALHKVRIK